MSNVDYNDLIAEIDAYVPVDNGDVSIRCGSLEPTQSDEERSWFGEIASANLDATDNTATFGALIQSLAQQIGARGGH